MRKIILFIFIFLLCIPLPWILISLITADEVYRDVDSVPVHEVGLLLGTSPSVNGMNNIFFTTRIEAAKTLYERGKIRQILVS